MLGRLEAGAVGWALAHHCWAGVSRLVGQGPPYDAVEGLGMTLAISEGGSKMDTN